MTGLCQKKMFTRRRQFQEGQERVEDEQHPDRPSTSTDEIRVRKIKYLVLKNRRLTIRDFVDTVEILKESVNTILKDFL